MNGQATYDTLIPEPVPCDDCEHDICCRECRFSTARRIANCECIECEEPEQEHTYCPDCKTVDGCSCDEQYNDYRDIERGL